MGDTTRFQFVQHLSSGSTVRQKAVVGPSATVGDVRAALEKALALVPGTYEAVVGRPPQRLDQLAEKLLLTECGLGRGGSVTVRTKATIEQASKEQHMIQQQYDIEQQIAAKNQKQRDEEMRQHAQQKQGLSPSSSSALTSASSHDSSDVPQPRRVAVPANNSCLFSSVIYLLDCPTLGLAGITHMHTNDLRTMVGSLVLSQPDKFTPAILGKSVEEYVKWIMDKDHWGGYIELTALAACFNTIIHAIDIQTLRIDTYAPQETDAASTNLFASDGHGSSSSSTSTLGAKNEGNAAPECCYLLYDGIHYDPLVMASGGDVVVGQSDNGATQLVEPRRAAKTFDASDAATREAMLAFARELHELRQYTNVGDFSLMCLDCQKGLRGGADAQKHAKETGHFNFCETEK